MVYVHCTPNADGSNSESGRQADADEARAQALDLSAFCCVCEWTTCSDWGVANYSAASRGASGLSGFGIGSTKKFSRSSSSSTSSTSTVPSMVFQVECRSGSRAVSSLASVGSIASDRFGSVIASSSTATLAKSMPPGTHRFQRGGSIMSTEDGARATPEQMQRQHIFVVNGSADFLDVVRELLQDEQYNVTTTNFVPHTFKQIEIARPSLLIVDLIHGEMAGWDLLAELRREAATRDIPVILVSTSKQLLEKAEAERVIWGGDCSFLKPFRLDALLQAIQELIGPA